LDTHRELRGIKNKKKQKHKLQRNECNKYHRDTSTLEIKDVHDKVQEASLNYGENKLPQEQAVIGPEYPWYMRLYGRGVTKSILNGKGHYESSSSATDESMQKQNGGNGRVDALCTQSLQSVVQPVNRPSAGSNNQVSHREVFLIDVQTPFRFHPSEAANEELAQSLLEQGFDLIS
ncbi:hypothetical protein HAX54_048416, partial [Datura stramonium]|nr:hypothetical protein [Datura stramonium]